MASILAGKPIGLPSTSGTDELSDELFHENCGVQTVEIAVDEWK